jgi:hypothetical protein
VIVKRLKLPSRLPHADWGNRRQECLRGWCTRSARICDQPGLTPVSIGKKDGRIHLCSPLTNAVNKHMISFELYRESRETVGKWVTAWPAVLTIAWG